MQLARSSNLLQQGKVRFVLKYRKAIYMRRTTWLSRLLYFDRSEIPKELVTFIVYASFKVARSTPIFEMI